MATQTTRAWAGHVGRDLIQKSRTEHNLYTQIDSSLVASWNSAILASFGAYALRVPALHNPAAQTSGTPGSSSFPSMHKRDQIQR